MHRCFVVRDTHIFKSGSKSSQDPVYIYGVLEIVFKSSSFFPLVGGAPTPPDTVAPPPPTTAAPPIPLPSGRAPARPTRSLMRVKSDNKFDPVNPGSGSSSSLTQHGSLRNSSASAIPVEGVNY